MFKLLWVRTWEKLGFAHLRAREGRLEERDTGERRQEGVNLGTTWMDLVRIYSLGVWSEWRTSQNEAYYSLVWINVRCCNEACLCLYRKYFHLTYFPLWNCENGRLVACHFRLQEEKEKWVGAEYQWLWWECELILLGEEMVCISYDWIQLQLRKNPPRSGLNKELVQCFKLPWGTQVPSVLLLYHHLGSCCLCGWNNISILQPREGAVGKRKWKVNSLSLRMWPGSCILPPALISLAHSPQSHLTAEE